MVCVRPDAGCACREWALPDVDIAEEMQTLVERQEDLVKYCTVVAHWNRRVAEAPEGSTFDFTEFCTYVLVAYDPVGVG
jgi:hypothetical protein